MILYPAIDLIAGKCVRLLRGNFDETTTYEMDPVIVAQDYAAAGAEYLHVIDLEGAKQGSLTQTELILRLHHNSGLKIQVGGGIRTEKTIETLLQQGITRVIIGSLAVKQPDRVAEWLRTYGSEKIVLALDVRLVEGEPSIADHAWQSMTTTSLWDLLTFYEEVGAKHVLCTDIDRDGTLAGPNIELYQQCLHRYPYLHFQASGGIGDLRDLSALKQWKISGAIVGKALYEQRFSLKEAIEIL